VFNKNLKGRFLLCNAVQCTLAIRGKWHTVIVCTRKGSIFEERVLQACNGVFYPACTAVAQLV